MTPRWQTRGKVSTEKPFISFFLLKWMNSNSVCDGMAEFVRACDGRTTETAGNREKRKPSAFQRFGHGSRFYCGHKAEAHMRPTSEASGVAPSHQRLSWFVFADVTPEKQKKKTRDKRGTRNIWVPTSSKGSGD